MRVHGCTGWKQSGVAGVITALLWSAVFKLEPSHTCARQCSPQRNGGVADKAIQSLADAWIYWWFCALPLERAVQREVPSQHHCLSCRAFAGSFFAAPAAHLFLPTLTQLFARYNKTRAPCRPLFVPCSSVWRCSLRSTRDGWPQQEKSAPLSLRGTISPCVGS